MPAIETEKEKAKTKQSYETYSLKSIQSYCSIFGTDKRTMCKGDLIQISLLGERRKTATRCITHLEKPSY